MRFIRAPLAFLTSPSVLRRSIYAANVAIVKAHNAAEKGWTMGAFLRRLGVSSLSSASAILLTLVSPLSREQVLRPRP